MSEEEEIQPINNEDHRNTLVSTNQNIIPHNNQLSVEVLNIDYGDLFYTHELFDSKDDLLHWVRTVAIANQMIVIMLRSEKGGERRKGRVSIGCECSGEYRAPKGSAKRIKGVVDEHSAKKIDIKDTGTKKLGCPFLLKGVQVSLMGPWALHIVNASHNHPLASDYHGHSYKGRLTNEEEEFVVDMSKNDVRPKNLLVQLQAKFPTNASTIKTIYNARSKHRVIERAGRSQMQYLMGKLEEHNYYYLFRRCEETGDIRDLFFAHPTSVHLLHAFPQVLLIDCTYKTNKYRLPLMEIVGVTSTDMTYSVGCAFLDCEKEDNYTWVLNTLRALMDEKCLPTLIITDREVALMNAVESVFPRTTHFLCRWHINRNIMAKCKKYLGRKEKWDAYITGWNKVVFADTEDEYKRELQNFNIKYKDFPKAVEYVMKNWVEPYGNRFMGYITNTVKHYGNTTTNRVESHHSALKRQLRSSMGNFETCWTSFHTLMEASHIAIKASFEKSINFVHHKYRVGTYMLLRGLVSTAALKLIHTEIATLGEGVMDAAKCSCILRKAYGLPCAHELSEYVSKSLPVPLDVIDDFWRQLDCKPRSVGGCKEIEHENRIDQFLKHASNKLHALDPSQREMTFRRINEALNPNITSITEPSAATRPRGRPRTSKKKTSTKRDPSAFELPLHQVKSCVETEPVVYETGPTVPGAMFTTKSRPTKEKVVRPPRVSRGLTLALSVDEALPPNFDKYVHAMNNVAADGHCGFRAIADLMDFGEQDWTRVRVDLFEELNAYPHLYDKVFMEHGKVDYIKGVLYYFEPSAPRDNWFCLPEMGHLVATKYNIPLVTLSPQECMTYLPLRTTLNASAIVGCIILINNIHFLSVTLVDGCPLPPICTSWFQYRLEDAKTWEGFVSARVAAYRVECSKKMGATDCSGGIRLGSSRDATINLE